jgi:hypothetical protein
VFQLAMYRGIILLVVLDGNGQLSVTLRKWHRQCVQEWRAEEDSRA